MLRFYFFTAKQGTWVHNFDRGLRRGFIEHLQRMLHADRACILSEHLAATNSGRAHVLLLRSGFSENCPVFIYFNYEYLLVLLFYFMNILSPVHMRWFTHGVQIIHICIICTRVYFWACERNYIYAKVNLHMCKYTPPCKYTPAQTRCIFAFAYMYFYMYVFLVMWTRSKYTPVCKCKFSSYFK